MSKQLHRGMFASISCMRAMVHPLQISRITELLINVTGHAAGNQTSEFAVIEHQTNKQ